MLLADQVSYQALDSSGPVTPRKVNDGGPGWLGHVRMHEARVIVGGNSLGKFRMRVQARATGPDPTPALTPT